MSFFKSGPIRARYEKVKMDNERLQEKLDSSQRQIEDYNNKIDSLKQVDKTTIWGYLTMINKFISISMK